MANLPVIRLTGLSRAEMLELSEYLDAKDVRFEEPPIPEGSLGELALATAIVVCAPFALRGLIAFLAYRYGGKSAEEIVVLEMPDGTRKTRTLRFRDVTAQKQEAELAKSLGDLTGLDLSSIIPMGPGSG